MSDSAEKQWERRACRALGAERRGNDGRGGSDDDGSSPFAIEAFMGPRPALPGRKLDQARRQGKATGRPWVLAQQVRGRPLALATVEFSVFVALVDRVRDLEAAIPLALPAMRDGSVTLEQDGYALASSLLHTAHEALYAVLELESA